MAKGDVENAIRAYCGAISSNPENYRAYSKAGIALWENDMIEEAMVSLHKSIDLNPNFDIAQNNLGVIYLDSLGCASPFHTLKKHLKLILHTQWLISMQAEHMKCWTKKHKQPNTTKWHLI